MIAARHRWFVVLVLVCSAAAVAGAGDRPLTFRDLMQFRQIEDTVISTDGTWIAAALVPDRGDGEVLARSTTGETEVHVERGAEPEISDDARWLVSKITPTLEAREKARRDDDDEPKGGLSILDLSTGEETRIDDVEAFALSADGRWLAHKRFAPEDEEVEDEAKEEAQAVAASGEEAEPETDDDEEEEEELGTDLVLRELTTGAETTIEHVSAFAFAENSALLAAAVAAPEGEGNSVRVWDRRGEAPETVVLHAAARGRYTELSWAEDVDRLAFVAAVDDEDGEPGAAEVWVWSGDGEARRVASGDDAPEGFTLSSTNELDWSRDGARLFFGFKPVSETETETETGTETDAEEPPFDPYDVESILADRKVDVWHWKDPRIIPNQKERWEEHEKDRVYRAVVHLATGRVVPLADLELPEVEPTDNPGVALGRSDLPYLREITWDGRYADIFVVDLGSGERALVARRLAGGWDAPSGSLSPDGARVLYYDDGDWFFYDTEKGSTRNLTAGLPVPFADEDWDYPADPPGYGHSEWLEDASGVLLYDKYDIWLAPVDGGEPRNLTRGVGREQKTVFRVVDLDPESEVLDPSRPILVEGYHDLEKHDAYYSLTAEDGAVKLFGDSDHRLDFVARADGAEAILFTRERYDEFPDLWFSDLDLAEPVRLTDVNPQIADFAWGKAELVEWTTDDGTDVQGVLIKPDGWQPGTRLPVLVYYYRFFSHRLHLFNEPVVNHRPSFPVYASSGYAVFLPDIRFEVGRPGPSAVECLTSGIEHLVEIGVADPDAIGLHGHSWSGYQTAFVVTQTDIFAAAVAGAPVSNMTSAYSGIRWGTGLARQFQYEKSQSRIGGSLWESPELYIENSPVFFADRISTPLLIQFGDEDEAVPWTQGIELYLACRRLDKDCIMLQYRGEPHHLKQYGNKLDYSIKMKQFFDHHLKGEPAPEWMTDGVPYTGE
ncbi:MAG: prolyl oligopeptidase family serine peptidase [Candidatus Sulfomarinibacteraceae bacterium]